VKKLIQGDCLEKMKDIESGSVDLILADPPYGTTACKWDSIIPLEPMWEQLKRIIKKNGAIVMTASQPFTTTLIASNMKDFKYCWYWVRTRPTGFLNSKLRPLKNVEEIAVFSTGTTANRSKKLMPYNPQGLVKVDKKWKRPKKYKNDEGLSITRPSHKLELIIEFENYPTQILKIKNHNIGNVHPTQKPVALMEYLIKTYTNEGEVVCDFCMGSGSTGVAARNTKRPFIGIELDPDYFKIAQDRIK